MKIDDEWAAYQFDVAAYTVGQRAINEAERAAYKKGKKDKGKGPPRAEAEPMTPDMIRALAKRG